MQSHVFHPSLLREYDLRGVFGETLSAADAYAVGRGLATRVIHADGQRVAVGRDGRLSSAELEAALVRGVVEAGATAVRIGLGPSPMLYFAEKCLGMDAGIHVTASHNPAHHNGFKMVLGGGPFFGEDIHRLARDAARGNWESGDGSVEELDGLSPYVERLAAARGLHALRVGWDAGNGAAGPVLERLTRLIPGEHHLLFTEVDGRFPNHHPDPTVEANLEHLRALVLAEKLDFGVAFDGDADRIGAVDGRGRIVRGDQLLAVLAEPVLRRRPGAAVVADVKAGAALFDRVRELGGRPVMWKSGHSNIRRRMAEEGAPLAGEMSGHVFLEDGWDDAPLAAVRLIAAVAESGRTLAELVDALPAYRSTPDMRVRVPANRRTAIVAEVLERLEAEGTEVERLDGARVRTKDGWWLLRASNTEDAVTIRAEAREQQGLDRLVAEVASQLRQSGVTLPNR